MTVRVLSFHADYACRHSGDCCTARWPIPADDGTLLPMNHLGCAFHDPVAHRCEIHAAKGHHALPVACRQFPRVSVLDPRGVSVTLSHFCPTARGLLEQYDGPTTVVENAAAFPITGEYVGFDARNAMPPLLRPGMLMDWESWWEWERLSVELFNRDEEPRELLRELGAAVEDVRRWKPSEGLLMDRVRAGLQQTEVRAGLKARAYDCPDRSLRRLLAAHAFANWTAHLGQGLRAWLRSLETVLFLHQEGWTIRDIDLWLRHFADPRQLSRTWSTGELTSIPPT